MGVERANHGGTATQGQNGYRNNYRNNYWQSETPHGNGTYGGQKFENGQKYVAPQEPHGAPQGVQGGVVPAPKHEVARNGFSGSVSGTVPSPLALEKKLSAMQQEMTQALQESHTKENEKFELIFSILMELQKRQGHLEESVKSLKAHFGMSESSQQQPQQQGQHPSQSSQSAQNGQQNSQQQVNGQMGQMAIIGMGGMGGQLAMAQQYGGMVATDGSQTYFTPVVVAMPQGGAQMMTMMPQIMAPNGMMPMQQQVAMPFMTTQVQNVDDYQQQQWNMTGGGSSGSNNGGATARSSGSVQNEENNSAAGGEHYKMEMPIEEEEE